MTSLAPPQSHVFSDFLLKFFICICEYVNQLNCFCVGVDPKILEIVVEASLPLILSMNEELVTSASATIGTVLKMISSSNSPLFDSVLETLTKVLLEKKLDNTIWY